MGSSGEHSRQQVQRSWGRKEFNGFEDEQKGANAAEPRRGEVGDEGGGVTEARSCGLLGHGHTLGFSFKWNGKSLKDLK